MSLVERAAKRLEELGKAGYQAVVDQRSPSDDQAAPSLIERAVQRLESAEVRGPLHQDADARIDESRTARDETLARGEAPRREPRLGAITARPTVQPHTRGVPRQAQRIELDLVKLASVGYLDPGAPESPSANEFRTIKRPLIQACQGKLATPVLDANRIMVTSSLPGEGKSFVSLNLALSIAMERDSTVLLIDADTTRRGLSHLLGISSYPGLLDLLGGSDLEVGDTLLRTTVERLCVMPAGEPRQHTTELLASETMERLVEEMASRYADRVLIFDTPPLLSAPEPAVLASHMGQILVVVEADSTTHKTLTSALATIESCRMVATILNKTTSRADAGYYSNRL